MRRPVKRDRTAAPTDQAKEWPITSSSDYPQKVLGGHTIHKSGRTWSAVVAVENPYGVVIRLMKWRLRKGEWKVALASTDITLWDWAEIGHEVAALKQRYCIQEG